MSSILAFTFVNDPSFAKNGNDPKATTSAFRQSTGSYAAQNINKGIKDGSIKPPQAIKMINKFNASPLGKSCILTYNNNSVTSANLLEGATVVAKRK